MKDELKIILGGLVLMVILVASSIQDWERFFK